MFKRNAVQLLCHLINLLLHYLEDLTRAAKDHPNDFIKGEKTAYTECLEILQSWEHAEENGLDFDIEERYPLD